MGVITIEQFLNYKKIKEVKHLITKNQYYEIYKIIEYYDTNSIKNRLLNITDFILNNVESKWLGRLGVIVRNLKNDAISEYACKIRYGDNWKIKQDEFKDKVKMDKNNFIKKYGIDLGTKKWEQRNKKAVSYGLKPAIERYGEEEGRKRWEKTLNSKIATMAKNKKIRPYRNGRTLPEYQNRYGIELGYKKWYDRNQRQSYRFSLTYYIDKYGEVDGLKFWNEYCVSMVKTTLNSFVDRYGDIEGNIRYDDFISRIKFSQSKEFFIEKYGEFDGDVKYKEFLVAKISLFKDKYSKISQDLFWGIFSKLENDDRLNCYFYELNNEYVFYVWENNMTIISVDFKLGNKIIEFDGDYWHSKDEQKKIDSNRDDFLVKKGYIVKRVKEFEYMSNKDFVINNCLNFLKNGTNFKQE